MTQLTLDQIEDRRQVEHMAWGLVALIFPYLSFAGLLLLGAFGIFYALYLSPQLLRVTTRPEESGRVSRAKLHYALASLCALALFWNRPQVGVGAFVILAIGDALSNLVGRKLGGRRLSYNPKKTAAGSLAFWAGGSLAAWLAMLWNSPRVSAPSSARLLIYAAIAAAVAGFIESLPQVIDDNITVVWTASAVLYLLFTVESASVHLNCGPLAALALNVALGVASYLLRWMTRSGAIAAIAIGVLLLVGFGWPGYLAGLVFVFLGSLSTRLGLKAKQERAIAEDAAGRGFWSVIGKGAAPGVLAIFYTVAPHPWLALAAVAALATAAFDTVASEIGKWLSPTSINLRTFSRMSAGAAGGVSWQGTLAGFVGAGLTALVPMAFGWVPLQSLPLICGASLAGMLFESIAKAGRPTQNEPERAAFNLYCVMVGACLAVSVWSWK